MDGERSSGVASGQGFVYLTSEAFMAPQKWKAEDKQQGLFAAWGPDIARREWDTVSITDLAPTILHRLDVPVPRDMDGRVLREIFAGGSGPFEGDAEPSGSARGAKTNPPVAPDLSSRISGQ